MALTGWDLWWKNSVFSVVWNMDVYVLEKRLTKCVKKASFLFPLSI